MEKKKYDMPQSEALRLTLGRAVLQATSPGGGYDPGTGGSSGEPGGGPSGE